MAVPNILFQNIEVNWVIPADITPALYDTVNIYKSANESQTFVLLASIPLEISGIPQTKYTDVTSAINAKNVSHYMVVFSHSTSGLVSASHLTYKSLSPREQRIVMQLRDYLSRFITNRLADEELRQYIELSLNSMNIYAPQTMFTIFSLPQALEPLLITGSVILGSAYNMLGIGFTDINYTDQGFSLTTDRYNKMTGVFDKTLKMYNDLLAIAKLDYAPGPEGVGTVALPIGLGGNLNRGILNIFDLLSAIGR